MSGNFEELDQFEQEEQEPKPQKKYYGKGFYTVGGTNVGCGCLTIVVILLLLTFFITAISFRGVMSATGNGAEAGTVRVEDEVPES